MENFYFTFEQLKNIAAQKYVEAPLASEGPTRNELLKEAETSAGREKVKRLSSEIRQSRTKPD